MGVFQHAEHDLESSIQKVAKAIRVRWAGHVLRIPDNNLTKMLYTSNPAGTRRKVALRRELYMFRKKNSWTIYMWDLFKL